MVDLRTSGASTAHRCLGPILLLTGLAVASATTLIPRQARERRSLLADGGVSCPALPGYDVYARTDRYGDDIRGMTASLESLAEYCTLTCSCKAFVATPTGPGIWQGWLKPSAGPMSPNSPQVCLYVRRASTECKCPSIPGYTAKLKHDLYRYNIKKASIKGDMQAMAAACNERCDCKAFSSWGQMKASIEPPGPVNVDMCYFSRDNPPTCPGETLALPPDPAPAACEELSGYDLLPGTDVPIEPNIDMTTGSLQTAAGACNITCGCRVFTTTPTGEQGQWYGWLKPNSTARFNDPRVCSYIRKDSNQCGCPAQPGYTAWVSHDVQGKDIVSLPAGTDVSKLAEACNESCECKSFNSLGWLKTTSENPKPVGSSICFYQRTNTDTCGCRLIFRDGDTIDDIASSYGTTRDRIQAVNSGVDLNAIPVGTSINMPQDALFCVTARASGNQQISTDRLVLVPGAAAVNPSSSGTTPAPAPASTPAAGSLGRVQLGLVVVCSLLSMIGLWA